jgi:IS30 family transposase
MTLSFIADNIGVNKSTISRELSCERQSLPNYQKWNNNGNLWTHLRHANKKRKKRYGKTNKRGIIPNKTMTDQRPKVVDNKSRIGDFELDIIIGKGHKGAVVTIVDRKSKLLLAKPVKRKIAALVPCAIIQLPRPYNIKHTHTLTPNNSKEFAHHQHIAKQLDTKVYFANPYSSWERGLNEHTNGLLRQYLPKQMPFDNLSEQQVNKAVALLNNRPRKSLDYQTPQAVFESGINAHSVLNFNDFKGR